MKLFTPEVTIQRFEITGPRVWWRGKPHKSLWWTMTKAKAMAVVADCTQDGVGIWYDVVRPDRKEYDALIMAVASKFPDETRHETALRYIQQAECRDTGSCAKVAD